MIANPIVPDRPLLLIDDNPENLRLEGFLLKSEGLPIRTAESAEQALDLLASGKFSLVLVDIQLPGMDGLELTRQIRNTPDLAGLPVVAVTAYSMPGDEERIREAGCDGYISKPINTRSFVGSVRAYLQA
jgi:CheY-like chemotaxis protein